LTPIILPDILLPDSILIVEYNRELIDEKTKPFWMEAGFIEELRKTEIKK
jgi:hypothetical protein